MHSLFLFNPENDIALALDVPVFTPPANVVRFGRVAAPLMWWLSGPDDAILLPSDLSARETDSLMKWAEEIRRITGVRGGEFVTAVQVSENFSPEPWGWSRACCQTLRNAGASGNRLPDEGLLSEIRAMSHRRTSVLLNQFLLDNISFGVHGCGCKMLPREVVSVDEFRQMVEVLNGDYYVKTPWSSSGRGVACSNEMPYRQMEARCAGIIRSQGCVMVEPAHAKVLDFAMLYRCDDGNVHFKGLSMFFNAHASAYGGNLLASQNVMLAKLAAYIPEELLANVRDRIGEWLESHLPAGYRGYIGIDMMVAQAPATGNYYLVPCVEVNLRTTMGVLALEVGKRLRCVLPADAEAWMRCSYGPAKVPVNNQVASRVGMQPERIFLVPENDAYNAMVGI